MKKKIIVTEDDADSLYMMVTALQEHGYEALGFKDGVTIIEGHCDVPDLYVLDNDMEYFRGTEIAMRLRNNKASASTPVLMVSGSLTDSHKKLPHGVDSFLAKPFQTKELLDAVKKLLDKRHP